MPRVSGDVIALPAPEGRWILRNVFARTSLGVDGAALELAGLVGAVSEDELEQRFADRGFSVWEIEHFSNEDGLLADPSGMLRDWPEAEELDAAGLLERLRKHSLLIDDEAAYAARFGPKTSLLDSEHFGNFHQQLGQHLMLRRREDPDAWWLRQKFVEDLSRVKDNLYGAIQASYLESYFPKRLSAGQRVLDVGCGPGIYTNMMARTGAEVLGIDPSEQFIQLATERAEPSARFEVVPVSEPGAMDHIESGSADVVFMSDALLFYFVPAAPNQVADIEVLLADIRRILKPGGRFISVEPHYIFWLQPWLGDPERPFTVLTEYLDKTFGVTGNISELVSAYTAGGFAVTAMEELRPDPSFESVDRRAYHFAMQFPLWQLFELVSLDG